MTIPGYFRPIFKYYEVNNGNTMVVEIDPQDGSEWPFHYLVYAEYNPTTQQWDLSTTVRQSLGISKPDKNAAIREACFQLVSMQNQQ
jgi:hypothetical protein